MTLLDAAEKVITEVRRPMGVKELCERILKRRLWKTGGQTPDATLSAALSEHVRKGGTRFVRCAPGVYGVPGMTPTAVSKMPRKTKKDRRAAKNVPGFVYIMTNPSFKKSWIKIGYTSGGLESVEQRRKELSNSSVPFPFEVYAVLKSFDAYDTEQRVHLALEAGGDSRLTPNREFFDLSVERALKAFKAVASEEAITYYQNGRPVRRPTEKPKMDAKKQGAKKASGREETWSGKTQLAKLIARRGGNEGAFGGILQYFSGARPCGAASKWRRLLEEAGVKFDAHGFVSDWARATNPL